MAYYGINTIDNFGHLRLFNINTEPIPAGGLTSDTTRERYHAAVQPISRIENVRSSGQLWLSVPDIARRPRGKIGSATPADGRQASPARSEWSRAG
jgi:hypothetical protein